MKRIATAAGLAVFAAMSASALVKDFDWARVEAPDEWNFRDPAAKAFEVKVTVKPGAPVEGCWLQPHLHWMRAAGYGGFASWQNPVKNPQPGKTYTFRYKPKVDEDKMHRFAFCGYLAPNGEHKLKKKDAWIDVKLPPPAPYAAKPADCLFKKSYIRIDEQPAPVAVGEEFTLKVKYYLDPSETWGPKQTILSVTPLGPWIDNPDGVINKTRHHVSYGGTMFTKEQRIEPGEHIAEFRFKVGNAYRYNSAFFLCKFKQPDGKDWPWDYRGGSLSVNPAIETLRLYPTARGGMFFYDETPSVSVVWDGKTNAGTVMGTATVKDALGKTVLEKQVELNSSRRVQMLNFPELKARGVFALTVKLPGLGKGGKQFEDFCYFGRIPRFRRIEGKDTPFGVTNVGDYDLSALAYDMGFTLARHFTTWSGIEPMRGKHALAKLDATVESNVKAGLKPWIQLHGPPAWSLPPEMGRTGEFEPAPFNLQDWANIIDVLAKRYKGKLYGFEFLNEIVPGKACKDPVATYVDICRVGYETAKRNDPALVCQLAGGLWPHSFRTDLLNAGVANYVDVLPVHYSNYEGVAEAKRDLAIRGIKRVRVADNETARGYTIWNYPPDMAFAKSLEQCRHVMMRWPDELCAGAEFITYFGGQADACGNWSYLLDGCSPRPVAATLAVVQGLLAYAKPVGKFFLGQTACHLFERDGKAILFVQTPGKEGVKVKIPAKGKLAQVDFQGNETELAGGEASTGDMPVIVLGADLAALKLHTALQLGTAAAPTALPQHVADAESVAMPLTVSNPYPGRRTFTVGSAKAKWGSAKPLTVSLDPGETKSVELQFDVSGNPAGATTLDFTVATKGVPAVTKPATLFIADSAAMGNLVANPGFEQGKDPWRGQGAVVSAAGPGNADNHALELKGRGKGYVHQSQRVKVPVPGGTYLYTAWVKGEGMGGGSNVDEYDANGKHVKNHMMLRIFTVPGGGTKGWNFLSKVLTLDARTHSVALAPVAQGDAGKRILYDNLQLSLYKGCTDVAFAGKEKGSPVPLLCENQVRAGKGYEWSEKNLGGVANFTWSPEALVFEAVVQDDAFDPKPVVGDSGEETLKGDAIALCIFPRIAPDGLPQDEQIRWYVSKASPGGGSGASTVFRPKAYSMGAKSGQLCKDSSVYQIDIRREGELTVYRLRIPWTEIPGFTPAKGAVFGCNIVLTDSDGKPAKGSIVWGAGLKNNAAGCGLVTLAPR